MSEQATPPVSEASEQPVVVQEAPASSGIGKKILGIVGTVLVVLLVIGLKFGLGTGLREVWNNISGNVSTASVGDCITDFDETKVGDAKIVDCAKAEAKFKVVGIVEDKYTSAEFGVVENPCTDHPTVEAFIWQGKSGKGDVWCLAAK